MNICDEFLGRTGEEISACKVISRFNHAIDNYFKISKDSHFLKLYYKLDILFILVHGVILYFILFDATVKIDSRFLKLV